METTLNSNLPTTSLTKVDSKTARLATSFFFLSLPLSFIDQFYVPRKILVSLDPIATANNLLSNEFIFRCSIVTHLAGTIIFALMILLFYKIFRPVDKYLSRFMVASVLAVIPVVFVLEVLNYTALMILKSDPRTTFDVAQQQEAAYVLLRMHGYGGGPGMGKLFLGLCFIPFGMLVLRSRFAPRIIGILLIIGGAGYLADCCTSILLQRVDYLMVRSFLMYTTLCYMLALLWFLVKGVREPRPIIN